MRKYIKEVGDILKEKGKWLYAIFILGWASMFIYFGFLFYFTSTLEDVYNIRGLKRGLIIAIPLVWLCVTSFIIGKIIGRHKKLMKWIIFCGSSIAAAALPVVGFLSGLVLLIVLLSIAGIGVGAALPSLDALITEGVEKENRGTITSLYSSMRLFGVAIGPPVTALLMKVNSKAAFFTLAGVSAAAAVITLILIKPPSDNNSAQKSG